MEVANACEKVRPIEEFDGIRVFRKPCDAVLAGVDLAEGGIH